MEQAHHIFTLTFIFDEWWRVSRGIRHKTLKFTQKQILRSRPDL